MRSIEVERAAAARGRSDALLVASVFISGMAALLYQIAWVRALVPVIGLDFFAVSAVATGTLTGLGLGSYIFGRISDWARNKLLVYLFLEIMIPLTSVAFLFLVHANLEAVNSLVRSVDSETGMLLLQFLFGGVTTLIPSLFMGGTLPALVGFVYSTGKRDDNQVALVYAVNTAGSVVSALVLSWLLIGLYGVETTFFIAAALNFMSAALAMSIRPRATAAEYDAGGSTVRDAATAATAHAGWALTFSMRRRLLVTYFLVGFVSLGFQQLSYRLTTFYWGGGTAQYSYVIGFFLLGLVGGAALTYRADPNSRWLGLNAASIRNLAWAGSLAMLLSPLVVAIAARTARTSESFYSRIAIADTGATLLLHSAAQGLTWFVFGLLAIAIPAGISGSIYPIINHLLARDGERVGHWTGLILLFGLAGSLVGGLLTTYLFLAVLGFGPTLTLLSVLLIVAGQLAWRSQSPHSPVDVAAGSGSVWIKGVSAALASACLLLPSSSALRFVSGHPVRDHQIGITGLAHLSAEPGAPPGSATVHINGKSQGRLSRGLGADTRSLVGKGLSPDAQSILVIGLGDGAHVHYLKRYFPTAQITVVEINREIGPLLHRHVPDDSGYGSGPRVNLILDDGRFFLARNVKQYDLIITNAVRSGDEYSSFLYSKEFFELVRSRLTPSGWFVGSFTPYAPVMGRTIADTLATVFPVSLQSEAGGLIAASSSPQVPAREQPSAELTQQICGQKLPPGTEPIDLERCKRVIGSMRAPSGQGARITRDDHPVNEFYFLYR